ncbi:MAG: hypothetical protein IPI81_00140 [Flavobacteriales bacterium]|nr:hypothetical protein [Flavobacteriales bacterium]MCC6937101.1 hypothetical protein [Flavobacteriales bacterium]
MRRSDWTPFIVALRWTLSFLLLGFASLGTAQFGVLDATFGTNGAVVLMNNNGSASAMLVLPDDRILTAGNQGSLLKLHQMLPDGGPDPAFGINGSVSTVMLLPEDFVVEELLRATNNDIILVGRTRVSGQDYAFAMVRFTPEGELIGSFGPIVYNEGPGSMWPMDAALTSDGRIMVCAGSSNGACLLRFLDDGSFDTSFSDDGVLLYAASGTACEMAVDYADRIVITGKYAGNSVYLARFDTSGILDPSFGNGGVVISDLLGGSTSEFAFALAAAPDGSLVVGGIMTSAKIFFAERYDANGVLVPTFGNNGRAVSTVNNITARDIVLQADGAVVLTGCKDIGGAQDITLLRLLDDGTPDPAFGTNGESVIAVNSYDDVLQIRHQSDGRVLISGYSNFSGAHWLVARITCLVDVGIAEVGVPGWTLFPNPASSRLWLTQPSSRAQYRLLRPDGLMLSSGIWPTEGLDVGWLASGSYLIGIAHNGQWLHQRFIKE